MDGSTTMMLGAPGTGKMPFGLHFLVTGAERNEPGLYFGFYEPPARVLSKGAQLGFNLGEYIEEGRIEILWPSPVETEHLFGPAVEVPFPSISAAIDVILLRYVELDSRLERFISILKMRGSGYDPTLRAFELTPQGLQVTESFQHVEALLTGVAHLQSKDVAFHGGGSHD